MNKDKAQVEIICNYQFEERYNSPFRAVVSKPVNEKYARKLAQDYLKQRGIYGVQLNKLYTKHNGVESEQPEGWIFGIYINPFLYSQVSQVSREV